MSKVAHANRQHMPLNNDPPLLRAEDDRRLLRGFGIACFFIILGWTIPYMLIVPVLRLEAAFSMMSTGVPSLLGSDLTLLVPCALAIYYVLFGKSVREFLGKYPWFGPFILIAFNLTLGTTLMAHGAYIASANKLGTTSVSYIILVLFLTWRIMWSVFAYWRPLTSFVVRT